MSVFVSRAAAGFLSTLSLRRATTGRRSHSSSSSRFLSTLSLRRATLPMRLLRRSSCHFYPRSPCGERLRARGRRFRASLFLSTLSLRRATRARGRRFRASLFLSTLSLRRATAFIQNQVDTLQNFYPRSPCGERLNEGVGKVAQYEISIHALLAESDIRSALCRRPHDISIHALLAESDGRRRIQRHRDRISIHALLAESDPWTRLPKTGICDFYPRSPCGERQ